MDEETHNDRLGVTEKPSPIIEEVEEQLERYDF